MKQGGFAPEGKWTGHAPGGVNAPAPILLPDPGRRFADTALRLETLAPGHPMQEWLCFMAELAHAQAVAVNMLPPLKALEQVVVDHAVRARTPPLDPDRYRRDAAWRDGLRILLDHFESSQSPIRMVVARLRKLEPAAIETMADEFLHGSIDTADAAPALYIAAALQVYFSHMAAKLEVNSLRLLPQRGLCPCCGSTPSVGLVTATGQIPGARYLCCSLCATAWNHVRAACITCGGSRSVSLEAIDGDAGIVKAETCNDCHTYAKMIYLAQDTKADPVADDLASLGLDILVAESGWSRHAPNPLLLVAR
ncbi:formate dehydrogenase accessory protein FdhE [Bradyrhizobium sp. CB2312]|uniref:formate dehydrogenase accessory protein FdhE n=1 Tax=Bradyrhizobium sp. CB2312 TaxID=3039155 RepID=UPI0024B05390|nr:formate dehydrogenase accessory protein FdhE [Bradyrhizobium sp. CB2312]WFU73416.1 formate dehydrogenase accessory protein FdhE [Bradyrhizobium sp. CB2312]